MPSVSEVAPSQLKRERVECFNLKDNPAVTFIFNDILSPLFLCTIPCVFNEHICQVRRLYGTLDYYCCETPSAKNIISYQKMFF